MENQVSQTRLSPPADSRMQMNQDQRPKNYGQLTGILNRNIRQLQIKRLSQIDNFQQLQSDVSEESQCNFNYQCVQEICQKATESMIFYYLYMLTMMIFLISCLLWDPVKNQQLSNVAQILELVCHIIFLIFFIIKALQWKNQKVTWLVFDFILIVTGIVGYSLPDGEAQRYMKAIRTLRLVYLIKQIKFLNEPTTHLMVALAKVGTIMIPALIIIYVYALVGLYSFSDFEYNRCRSASNKLKTNSWTVYEEEVFLCGERSCPVYQNEQLQCLNPIDYGVEPTESELVNIVQGNGLLRYNNILYAFLSTLKQTFGTGSSRLILLYKQVLSPFFVLVYYYSYIYLISYIYLNIFFSLIIVAEWDEKENENEETNKLKNELDLQDDKKTTKKKIQTKKVIEKKQSINSNLGSQLRLQSDTLQLKKTKIHNVFEQAINQPDLIDKVQEIQPPSKEQQNTIFQEDQDTTLSDKYPDFFCGYIIFSDIIIILNCVNLSLEFHGESQNFGYVVSVIDFSFYVLFIFQVLFKIIIYKKALGRLQLGAKIDIFILILCTVGVIYEIVTATNLTMFLTASGAIQKIFRSFKYLRIFVLILQTPFFKESRLILTSTFHSVYSIKNVVVLWFLIVLIISIMGFHLHSYKTKVDANGKLDLQNGSGFQVSMDGIFQSFIFTMLTFYNEEWDYLMFQQYLGSGALIVIWQLISIVVGLMLFSKYFMALLMNELDSLMDDEFEQQQNNEELQSDLIPDDIEKEKKQEFKEKMEKSNMRMSNKVEPQNYSSEKESFRMTRKVQFNVSQKNIKEEAKVKKKKTFVIPQQPQDQDERGRTICLKKCTNILRKGIEHKAFNVIKVIFIFLGCVVLICIHPQVSRTSTEAEPFLILDKVCFSFFMLQLILSLVVFGLFQDPNSYLRRSWLNWFNIVILIIQILSFTALGQDSIFMKVQRIKVFRILFFVELRYKSDWNMRMTYHAFVQLLPKVLKLLAVTIIIYMYFALILVKLYKDDFYYCSNYESTASITNKNDCLSWGGDWLQRNINTANLFNSTLFLFLVATTQGWITLMTDMMNMNGIGNEPSYNSNQYINIFFAFFFFFGNLILLNVFVGLSVSNFKRLKQKTTGESRLTKKEKMWLSVKQQIYRLQPLVYEQKPTNTLRGYAFQISKSKAYKVIKGLTFAGFVICISVFHTNMTAQQRSILKYTQYGFVGILFIEEIIELLAYGLRISHWKDIVFRNLVLIYCIIYMFVDSFIDMNVYDSRVFGAIFVCLQFFRYISVLFEITFVRKLLNAIATILPRTSNILLLLSITLFIYTIFGMELFSFLRFSTELDQYNQNYTSFGSALFALVKFSTMQSPIQQIVDAAQTSKPNFICNEITSYEQFLQVGQSGCGSQAWSYIFFLSFHIFYSLLLMSMFLAVIVDSYSEVKKEENAFITKFVLEKVRNQWSKIDPEAIGFIPYRQFWMFTAKLLSIYMGQEASQQKKDLKELFSSKEQLLAKMAIPIYENQNGVLCFQFHEVIEALTRIYIQNTLQEDVKSKKAEEMFKERQSDVGIGFKRSFYTSSHVSTLIILKSGLRWWKNLANKDNGPLQYKLIMQKFSEGKKEAQ